MYAGRAIEHMGVNHRGAHIPVSQGLVDDPDVVAVSEEAGGKRMAQVRGPAGLAIPAFSVASFTARWKTDSSRSWRRSLR